MRALWSQVKKARFFLYLFGTFGKWTFINVQNPFPNFKPGKFLSTDFLPFCVFLIINKIINLMDPPFQGFAILLDIYIRIQDQQRAFIVLH